MYGDRTDDCVQKTKRFQTQKLTRWQLIDRLTFLIPLGLFLYFSLGSGLWDFVWESFGDEAAVSKIVVFLLFCVLVTGFISTPLVLGVRAITRTLRKNVAKNASFNVIEDLDYYREKLSGLSPVGISLLMDMEIETKKDVAASILRYSMLGVVSLQEETIMVVDPHHPSLKPSDHILLQQIAYGTVDKDGLARWEREARNEAFAEGYVTDLRVASNAKRESASGCMIGCVMPFLVLVAVALLSQFVLDIEGISLYLDAIPEDTSNADLVQYLVADPGMLIRMLAMVAIAIIMVAALIFPWVFLVRAIAGTLSSTPLRRTEKGEVLAEQLAGLKNFIHDFSDLSQAEKEKILVWDDFLVYVVILEENKGIIDDIFGMKNFDYGRYQII